jgi:hypothetical protein
MLVHLELGDVDHQPDSFLLLMIDVPDSLPVITLDENRLSLTGACWKRKHGRRGRPG